MDKYPLTYNFISKAGLNPNHFLNFINDENENISAFELFFSMENLPGFSKKLEREIKTKLIQNPSSINGEIQWASICAELTAIQLVFKKYGVEISGFDQHSPRSLKENNDCDFSGIWQGETLYFEVKNNSKEESQDIPQILLDELKQIKWGYTLFIEAKCRYLKITNTNKIIQDIKKHIADHNEWKNKYVPSGVELFPGKFHTDKFIIRFLPQSKYVDSLRYFTPPSLQDICSFLFGVNMPNNSTMTPKIEEARQKGADYLICRLPRFQEFHEIIDKCFKLIKKKEKSIYIVSGDLIKGIVGVILFNKKGEHCLILNADDNQKWYLQKKSNKKIKPSGTAIGEF